MKSVISAVVIFIFIVVTGLFSTIYVDNVTKELLQNLYKNEIYFSNLKWEEAEDEILKLENFWAEKRPVLSVFINHANLTEVEITVSQLKNATKIRKIDDIIYAGDKLALILSDINEQQKISIANIF